METEGIMELILEINNKLKDLNPTQALAVLDMVKVLIETRLMI